jgi:transcriptional regulator with XRE-family HTH domain
MIEEADMLVQKLRLQRGWSQEQLAELSGLSTRTIQRLERGQSASAESLKAVASVFEIDFSTLRETKMDDPANPNVRADEALALAHVRKIKAFYIHLTQYVVIVGALAILNLFTMPSYPWILWVAGGWGVGVFAHGLRVFNKVPFLNGAWERQQVEKYLGREL